MGKRGAGIDEVASPGQRFLNRGLAGAGDDARPALGERINAAHITGRGIEHIRSAIAEPAPGLGIRCESESERAREQRNPPGCGYHSAVISDPAPCSVKSSSRRTWGMRPSRMTAAFTPAFTAALAGSLLGIMPPRKVRC